MRFFLILLTTFFSFSLLNGQTDWFSIDTNQRSGDKKFKQVIQIVNDDSKHLVSFFQYYNFFVAYLHNADGTLINTFSANALPKNKRNYLGTSINGNIYTLFFQNDYGTKFSALSIDFTTSKFEFTDKLEVHSNVETVIGSFEYKYHIYILTSVKRSSKLKLYELKNHTDISEKTYDFSDTKFITPRGFEITLDRFLDGGYDSPNASLIENNEPGAIEISSMKNKLFLDGESLVLTNDVYDTATTYLSINLEDDSTKHINFLKETFNKKDRGSKSNSFVLDDYFFNLYVTKEFMDFSIYNISSQALVKNIRVNEDDPLDFKNSPIILENGSFESYRELDRTKQFLRKVSSSIPGIYVYKNNGEYVVILGGCEPASQGDDLVFISTFVGGLALGVMVATLTPSYESYTNTKSTRIECLFNEKFESVEGEIPSNAFDKIETYIDSNSDIKFKHKSIFKANSNYILGYFEKETKLYKYISFGN